MPLTPSNGGLIDTHVHVFDPARFPYGQTRVYTPPAAPLDALRQHLRATGADAVLLVQPSVYGHDNACLLDAIQHLGQEHARGIAVVDLDHLGREELQPLHDAGVRGIRLNLEVRHEDSPDRARAELLRAADAVDLPGWCVQVHCAASLLPVVSAVLPRFRVPVVLDHFAGLKAKDAVLGSRALDELLGLLEAGRVYVKLSAFYRASDDPPMHADLASLAQALMRQRTDRLLWGSDWPHTGGGRDRDPARIEPFRQVDLASSLKALASWCPDEKAFRLIASDNAAELYGFARDRS